MHTNNVFSFLTLSLLIPTLLSCATKHVDSNVFDALFMNDMVLIEGGWFLMGCSNVDWLDGGYCHSSDCTSHLVYVYSFFICKYEVTLSQWKVVMGNYPDVLNEKYLANSIPNYKNVPVFCVSWSDCQKFVNLLNKNSKRKFRLPTEAEWEYAATGGNKSQNYIFSGSDSIKEVAVVGYGPKQVGSLMPNELGLFDMSGNVKEWCSDLYGDYKADKQINPKGAETGSDHVVRGGSHSSYLGYCAIRTRDCADTNRKIHMDIGIRLVMEL